MSQHEEAQAEMLSRYRPLVGLPEGTLVEVIFALVDMGKCALATELLFGTTEYTPTASRGIRSLNKQIFFKLKESCNFGEHIKQIARHHEWKTEMTLSGWSFRIYQGEFLVVDDNVFARMLEAIIA